MGDGLDPREELARNLGKLLEIVEIHARQTLHQLQDADGRVTCGQARRVAAKAWATLDKLLVRWAAALIARHPQHARLVDDAVEQLRAQIRAGFEKIGEP